MEKNLFHPELQFLVEVVRQRNNPWERCHQQDRFEPYRLANRYRFGRCRQTVGANQFVSHVLRKLAGEQRGGQLIIKVAIDGSRRDFNSRVQNQTGV